MRDKVEEGVFYCPNCSAQRKYSNIYEVGIDWSNRGYRDYLKSERCIMCGDETNYQRPGTFRGLNFLRPKCPSCGKHTFKGKYCAECGASKV